MVLFLDTNILLDFINRRGAFFSDAEKVLAACAKYENSAYIASVSVTNCFYILRKELPLKTTKSIFRELLQIIDVADTSKQLILSAIENDDFRTLRTVCNRKWRSLSTLNTSSLATPSILKNLLFPS